MKTFAGIYLAGGQVRRLTMEAETLEEAQAQAKAWGVGVEGETLSAGMTAPAEPVSYDIPTTRRLLGNLSRATIYRWVIEGRLERVPDTRRVLITRKSVERLARN